MSRPELDFVSAIPFAGVLGVELLSAAAEEVRGSMTWAPERCTVGGVLHGGALIALADTLGAICAFLNLPDGATTTTVESKTNFFRAVRDGQITATARPLHVGRSFIVVQSDLLDAAARRVAQVTQTQAVLYPRAHGGDDDGVRQTPTDPSGHDR
jgi:1,4-dihydroxy-2-naphthoyl-CoA hydrolase